MELHLLDHRVNHLELHVRVKLSAFLDSQSLTIGSQLPYILRMVDGIKSGRDAVVMIVSCMNAIASRVAVFPCIHWPEYAANDMSR